MQIQDLNRIVISNAVTVLNMIQGDCYSIQWIDYQMVIGLRQKDYYETLKHKPYMTNRQSHEWEKMEINLSVRKQFATLNEFCRNKSVSLFRTGGMQDVPSSEDLQKVLNGSTKKCWFSIGFR